MALTNQDYTNFVTNNNYRTPIAKLEVMDLNENVLDEIRDDIISGDVTIENKKGARRSANVLLYNAHGKYTPGYRNTFWLNKKIRVWSGMMINGEEFWVSKGVFMIGEVQVISAFAEKTVTVTLVDKMTLLNGESGGTLVADYLANKGELIESLIIDLLAEINEPRKPIIFASSTPTPYFIAKEKGMTYADVLEELSGLYSSDYYYDKNGTFHFEPSVDYTLLGSSWDFADTEATYLGANHRYKFTSIHNIVWVYGNNITGTQVKAYAQDTYAFSTTRVSLIGERPMVIEDENISTTQQAQDRADYELKKAIILQEAVDISTIPIDILEEDNVFTILDTSGGLNREMYYTQTIQFPLLSGGEMTITCWKVRPLS